MEMQFNPITTQLDMVDGGGGSIEPVEYNNERDTYYRTANYPGPGGSELNSVRVYFEVVPGLPLATVSVGGTIGDVKKIAKDWGKNINFHSGDNMPRVVGGGIGFPLFVSAYENHKANLSSHTIIGYMVMGTNSTHGHLSATLTPEGMALPDDARVWAAPQMVRIAKREAQ